jgi:transcriptional regulator with XRE-family HTH domain
LPGITFAERLRSLRVARRLTRAALARAAQVTGRSLAVYEQGRGVPRVELLARLAGVLGPGLVGCGAQE